MREIKYRGLNEETGEFVYGWYTKLVEGIRRFDAIIADVDGDLNRFYIHNKETIRQFTYFKDKNGKDIYDGDTVKVQIIWNEVNHAVKREFVSRLVYAECRGCYIFADFHNLSIDTICDGDEMISLELV